MIEPDRPEVKVESLGGLWPRIVAVVAAISIVLVVAVLKPWSQPAHTVPTPGAPVAAVSSAPDSTPLGTTHDGTNVANATASAVPEVPGDAQAARGRMLCGDEPEWRLLTMEVGFLGIERTLYGDLPATAAGPTDQAIPLADVTASSLLGIGVCRPGELDKEEGDAPVTGVNIWQVSAEGSASMVSQLATIDPDLSRAGEAYFRPLTSGARETPSGTPEWDPGRYVVEIDGANEHGAALWLAVDFTNISARSSHSAGENMQSE